MQAVLAGSGMVVPPSANDIIFLQQNGVSPRVIQAMQEARPPQPTTVIVQEEPRPMVVGGYYYYGRPYYGHPHRYYW